MFAGTVIVDGRIASSVSQNSPEFLRDPPMTGVIHQAGVVSEREATHTMGQIPHIGQVVISLQNSELVNCMMQRKLIGTHSGGCITQINVHSRGNCSI